MNPAWPEIPFERIVRDTKDGEWGESAPGMGLREVLIIRGTDFESVNSPSADFPRRWVPEHLVTRKRLEEGDLILETAGGTSSQSTGRSVLLKSSFFEQHPELPVLCASFSRHLRIDHENFDARFLSYLLQTLYRSGYMGVFNIQHTGVSRFQFTTFKNHTKLRIPKRSTQRKIAAVLAAYDDLIEANRRRIALLERMAEETHREWFVRLRFPGHAKTKITKGLPVGWRDGRFRDLCRLQRGYDLPDALIQDGPYPVIASTAIKAFHAEFKVEPPVITTGRSGSLGKVLLVNQRAWPLNTSLYVRDFHGNSPYLVFYTLRGMGLESFNSGAGVPTLNRNHLEGLRLAIPPPDLQTRFDECVGPIHRQGDILEKSNTALQRTRDLLLPRLISGKLPVEDLAIAFPPSMTEK